MNKISLATIYNTVHAFKDKGYLKEITISSDIKVILIQHITNHHHFYDEDTNLLID